MTLNRTAETRSLAHMTQGDEFEVVEVLFDVIRRMCPTLGLSPGEVLRCEGRAQREIRLRREDGTRVTIDPFYASFVAVSKRGATRTGRKYDQRSSSGARG